MARASKTRSVRTATSRKTAKKRTSVSNRVSRTSSRTEKTAAKTASPRRQPRRAAKMVSRTATRAKWIENAVDHADRPGQSLATRNHEVIRKWAEDRGAVPATVHTTRQADRPRVLRFDFPGFGGGKRLEQISWDEWFKTFDERELVFLFQEHLKNGNQSNFFRLNNPEREAA